MNLDLTAVARALAESVSYAKASYFMLTKDLPPLYKERIDLMRRMTYLEVMIDLSESLGVENVESLTSELRGDMAELEARLTQLDSLGIVLRPDKEA